MTTTVADLLGIDELHLGLVAGKQGLDRPIRWAHVSELKDPTRFLRGGEVLLTTGLGMRGGPGVQAAYVEQLAAAGLAALGLGLGFAFKTTPPAVLEAADRTGFPVFEVPFEVPFIAITEALFSRLVNEQYVLLQRAGTVQQTLSRLLVEGAGLDTLLEAYTRMTGTRALLLDVRGEVLAAARGARAVLPPRDVWAEIQALRPEGNEFSLSLSDEGGSRTLLPVLVGGGPAGFLVLHRGTRPEPFHQVVVHHLATAIALELSKAQAVARTERRLVGDFLDALLEGELSASEIRRRLRFLGLGGSPAIAVLVARREEPDRSEAAVEALRLLVQDRLSRRPGPFVCSVQDAAVVALFEAAGPEVAREAADAVAGTGDGAVATVNDLGAHRLLVAVHEEAVLDEFVDALLAPLRRYDQRQRGELLPSLRAFLEHNGNWEAAARALGVHRHTLRYRIGRVEELTGRTLSTADDRVELWLALRVDELRGGHWRQPEA